MMKKNKTSRKSINLYLQSHEVDLIDIPLTNQNHDHNLSLRHSQPLLTKHRQRLLASRSCPVDKTSKSGNNQHTIDSQYLAML